MCGGSAVNTYLRKQYIEPRLAKQKATVNASGAKNPSSKGKAEGKPGGTRQTSKSSASGFKGTDKRGDLVSGGRKEPGGKKTLLGG